MEKSKRSEQSFHIFRSKLRHFRKFNLQTKLIAIFLLMNLGTVAFLSMIAYFTASHTIEDKVYENIAITASQIAFSVNSSVASINRTMDYIFSNTELQTILTREEEPRDTEVDKKVKTIMDNYFVNMPELLSCVLSDIKGNLYFYRRNVSDKELIFKWIQQSLKNDGQIAWLGAYELSEMSVWTNHTLVVSRAMKNLTAKDVVTPIGTVTLFFSNRILESVYDYIGEETSLMVIDAQNRTISSSGNEARNRMILNYLNTQEEKIGAPFDIWLEGEKYMMASYAVPAAVWKVVETIPYQEINKNFRSIQSATGVTVVLIVGGTIVMSIFFSKKIVAPLLMLNREMKKVSVGNFNVYQFPRERLDEIGQIQRGFNEMVDRMQDLLHTTVEKEKEKQLAELTALQYQVNPHFLYNTLNSVRLMALMTKSQNIVSMLDSLIHLLRKSAGKCGTVVSLRDELETVNDFVNIHRIRYQYDIQILNDLSEEALECLVPCFLIQPLVENALFHGFSEKGGGTISFSGGCKDGVLTIVVADDGVGMSEKQVHEVMTAQHSERPAFVNVGIRNVDDRLKINYGPQFGLRLESKVKVGTKITVTMPVIRSQEGETLKDENHDCR